MCTAIFELCWWKKDKAEKELQEYSSRGSGALPVDFSWRFSDSVEVSGQRMCLGISYYGDSHGKNVSAAEVWTVSSMIKSELRLCFFADDVVLFVTRWIMRLKGRSMRYQLQWRSWAEPEGFTLDVPVNLLSNLHPWSWALGSDRKNEIVDTSRRNLFPWLCVWVHVCEGPCRSYVCPLSMSKPVPEHILPLPNL